MSRYKPKGKPTKEELAHMGKVAQMPCCNCYTFPVQVHHITEGYRRHGCKYVLPLCPLCHAGVDAKGYQWEMEKCREVYEELGLEFIEPTTKVVPRKMLT